MESSEFVDADVVIIVCIYNPVLMQGGSLEISKNTIFPLYEMDEQNINVFGEPEDTWLLWYQYYSSLFFWTFCNGLSKTKQPFISREYGISSIWLFPIEL